MTLYRFHNFFAFKCYVFLAYIKTLTLANKNIIRKSVVSSVNITLAYELDTNHFRSDKPPLMSSRSP